MTGLFIILSLACIAVCLAMVEFQARFARFGLLPMYLFVGSLFGIPVFQVLALVAWLLGA